MIKGAEKRRPHVCDLIYPLLLLAAGLWIGLPRHLCGVELGDEGLLAYGAERVFEGQQPHRDFFTLQPPLTYYAAAAAFKLLGTSLGSLRVLGLGLHLVIPLLIYSIARSLLRPHLALAAGGLALVVGLPYFAFVPFAAWEGVTFTLAAVVLLMLGIRASKRRGMLAFAGGILTVISALFRHDQAVFFIISVLICNGLARFVCESFVHRQQLAAAVVWWGIGIVVLSVPLAVYFQAVGMLQPMFQQLVVFPMTTYWRTSATPFPRFTADLLTSQNAEVSLFCIPPILELTAISWLFTRRKSPGLDWENAVLVFLLIWAPLCYCQALTRSDLTHLFPALAPFFVLGACCAAFFIESVADMLQKAGVRLRIARAIPAIVCVSAVLAYLVLIRPVLIPAVPPGLEGIAVKRAGSVRDERLGPLLTQLITAVQNFVPRDRSILCLPYQPLFYFLSERRNPTHWNYLWPGDQTAEDHAQLVREAKADPPALVLIMHEEVMAKYAPTILNYVHAEYQRVETRGELLIYQPRAASAKTN